MLDRAGVSLMESGQVTAALEYYRDLVNTAHHHLGPDHRDTIDARHNLTFLRGEAGDAVGAAAALEELLPACLRVLGPDHPATLIVRDFLAHWQGQPGEASERRSG
ncbi:tetratricopeptide repeat protein [Streptomyces sp. bgisy095]|uniref:tetratricopeptide repeat protein n=1 Tax=unclassified Streptomyces TaxID=2593676 RepID=UPI003D71EF90